MLKTILAISGKPGLFKLMNQGKNMLIVESLSTGKRTPADIRAYFKEVLPDFDEDRVYTNDIKKVLNWYNQLLAAGITEFVSPEEEENATEEKGE